jgi:hypothetical protein
MGMKLGTRAVVLIALSIGLATVASATIPIAQFTELNNGLKTVASALGTLVITYAGIKWIMSEGPQERDDAKKTIIYALVGLIIVSLADELVAALYHPL